MDWTKSYTSIWRVFRVNRKTWADAEPLSKVDSVSISRTEDGSLIESGAMSLSGDFEPDYYRIVMIAEQGGERVRVDVATLLFDISAGNVNYGNTTRTVSGFSVLHPAATTAVAVGEYAPAGSDGAKYAANLLESAINAPVDFSGSFTLNDHVVHETGATVLSAVWNVLNSAPNGYIIQIDGAGVVHIRPKPTEPSLTLSNETKGLMQNGISFSENISEIPNRYVVIDETSITIATNDDPNSPISTVSRGYNVDVIDTAPTYVNGETKAEYADRMLRQSSVLKEEKDYVREYAPDVYPYSIVRGSINGLDGDLRVASQTINCTNGITVAEHAYKETQLW